MDLETVEEIERRFGIIAESLRDEIRTVAEGLQLFQGQVEKRFDLVDKRFELVDAKLERLDLRMAPLGLRGQGSKLRASAVAVDRRVRALEARPRP